MLVDWHDFQISTPDKVHGSVVGIQCRELRCEEGIGDMGGHKTV